MILCVPPHQARAVWPLVEPILRRATDRTNGRFTTDDTLRHVERGTMQLWISDHPVRAVAVTSLEQGERDKTCRFVFAAGDMDTIIEGLPCVERWARDDEGCAYMELLGRRGWERALTAHGYGFDAVLLHKEI